MIELFISALALGFLFNAVPGAIFTESLRRGLQGGFKSALYVQFGSLVGDLTWAVLGLGGAAVLFEVTVIKIPLAIFGGLLLAWLALNCRSRSVRTNWCVFCDFFVWFYAFISYLVFSVRRIYWAR